MRRQEHVGGRSVDTIAVEHQQLQQQQQQQEVQAETVFFSNGSLYAVGAMLTLAVLFCAGVLAYTVRRNDMLKTEYHRLMAAIAERGSKSSRVPTETEPPETVETMGPAPRVDDATQDAILLLLTHKPISNIDHPERTKRTTTTAQLNDGETIYYDDAEGIARRTLNSTRSGVRATLKTGNNFSGSDPVTPQSSATPLTTPTFSPNSTQATMLKMLVSSTPKLVNTARTIGAGNSTGSSNVNASSSSGISTHLTGAGEGKGRNAEGDA